MLSGCWVAIHGCQHLGLPTKQLPRLPTDAGLVPIKLKRKKEYKSHEKSEWIRPEQIFLALRYLRKAGNPYYQFYDDEETYKARCRIKDQRGLRLLEEDKDDIEEDLEKPEAHDEVEVEDQAVRDSDDGEDEMEIAMEQEEEDIENDPVRRQHFNYNEYSTLVNGHPEIFLDGDGNQVANLDFAPGLGRARDPPASWMKNTGTSRAGPCSCQMESLVSVTREKSS